MSVRLRFNPRARLYPFDSADSRPMFVCEIPSQSATAPNRYVLPVELLELLRMFKGTDSADDILAVWLVAHRQYTPEKLNWLIHEYFLSKGLLVDREDAPPPQKRRSYMYFKVTLLPARLLGPISKSVSWLFDWRILISLLPVFIVTQIIFFAKILPQYHFNLNTLSGGDFLLVLNIATVFGLIHELGHASALRHFGNTRASIGWGIYLNFTVLYTDLSDIWRLPRNQRALVDAGGIYFHCISLVGLLALILCTHLPHLVYCFFFIDLQIAGSLNPFLRMDGYWLVSDLLGVADLRGEILRLLVRFAGVFLRRQTDTIEHRVPLPKWKTVCLLIFMVVGAGFCIVLYKILFGQLVFKVLPAIPQLLATLARLIAAKPFRFVALLNLTGEIAWKGLALYGFTRMIWSFLRMLSRSFLKMSTLTARKAQPQALQQEGG